MFNSLRSIIFWAFLLFFIIFPWPIFALFARDKKAFYQKAVRFVARAILFLSSTKIEVAGKENLKLIDHSHSLIIAANHSSFLDAFFLLANLPFLLRFTAYRVGFNLPFIKNIYKNAGYIGVGPRGINSLTDLNSLFKALEAKDKIVILSEFKQNETEFEFDQNLLQLSQRFSVPILPVALRGSSKLLPMNKLLFNSAKAGLCIGKPAYFISPKELKQEILKLHASFS